NNQLSSSSLNNQLSSSSFNNQLSASFNKLSSSSFNNQLSSSSSFNNQLSSPSSFNSQLSSSSFNNQLSASSLNNQLSSSSFNNQLSASTFNNQLSSSSLNNQSATTNVVDGFRVPLNKYPMSETANYQRSVPPRTNYTLEAISKPASTISSNFNPAKAFGVELATDDETDDDRTVDTPLPTRDALANAIASPASALLDAKLLSQVSDAVARVEAHKAAARRQHLSSNLQSSPTVAPDTPSPAKKDSNKLDQVQQQQYPNADSNQVKQKFYELLRKYQKVKQNRPQQIVTEDDINSNKVECNEKTPDMSGDRAARRPALMGSRPRPSLLGSGDSWKPQENSSLNTVEESSRDNYGREYKNYANDRKVEMKNATKPIDDKNPM
uniref:Uncharacterized protein n=1 Tax=Romanomermis culicivorax TaxID=13658 RepID=A0A915KZ91_ROMCU